MNGPKKKVFAVEDFGSVDKCLRAMEQEGYTPVRKTEKPIFKESPEGVEVAGRSIIFEGKLTKSEQ